MNKSIITTFTVVSLVLGVAGAAGAAPLMYVATGDANDLVIIDLESDRIVGRIDELENAHGLAASAKTDYLVAGSMKPQQQEGGDMAKPAAVSEEEHAAHHAGGEASEEIQSPSFLSIIHPEHGHVMRRIAVRSLTHHTAISPDGRYAIAVHSGAGGISVVDLDKMDVITTVQTGGWPNYAVFSPSGERLYISNAQPGTLSEIETQNWSVKREIKVGKKPEHMVMSRNGEHLFIVDVEGAEVVIVDVEKNQVLKRLTVGAEPHGVDVTDDGKWLFVSSKGGEQLARFELDNDRVETITLQPAPYHLDYVDAVGKLYVSSRQSPLIWVFDPKTLAQINQIDIGKGVAHQMAVR
ncbi:MAG TPA: hypothetical protein VLB10_01445 [Gammaproteobacteria bacterium]|jgi:YVTN family beta-propeller protein|nr:hypothetical protein [Gammaproteobacteria bacterium]